MSNTQSTCQLPCIVQLGFAGSRHLFDGNPGQIDRQALELELEARLTDRLKSLKHELELGPNYHFCGISQVAIGADLIFSRACRLLDIPQRVFLPQHEDAYLAAAGSDGTPDFPADEVHAVETLLQGKHIIEHRLASEAADRQTRFEDTNRAIVAESDIVICLVRKFADNKPGGTAQFIELAREGRIPALILEVSLQDGKLAVEERWHRRDGFKAPVLPHVGNEPPAQEAGAEQTLPTISEYIDQIKSHYSKRAKQHKEHFVHAARIIIGTHILATLLATAVLAGHGALGGGHHDDQELPLWPLLLLAAELVALSTGLWQHRRFHETNPSPMWALHRLMAEITRSVKSLGTLPMPLDYLYRLRLSVERRLELRPLLRTLNVLHLRTAQNARAKSLQALRDAYLDNRLINPESGQIPYYRQKCKEEQRYLGLANAIFMICSSLAILATLAKLLTLAGILHVPPALDAAVAAGLGFLAIFLPVLAVGALSWAAAQDYEARVQTFRKTQEFLHEQRDALEQVTSATVFRRLVEETELELLGETTEWYSRRIFGKAT